MTLTLQERVEIIQARYFLGRCEYELPETQRGRSDGLVCGRPAVVTHRESERRNCLEHYEEQEQ